WMPSAIDLLAGTVDSPNRHRIPAIRRTPQQFHYLLSLFSGHSHSPHCPSRGRLNTPPQRAVLCKRRIARAPELLITQQSLWLAIAALLDTGRRDEPDATVEVEAKRKDRAENVPPSGRRISVDEECGRCDALILALHLHCPRQHARVRRVDEHRPEPWQR